MLFGALTAIALNVYTDHAGLVMGSSSLVKSQYPMAMLLPFVLWLFANIGLKNFWPKAAFSGTELLVIYSHVLDRGRHSPRRVGGLLDEHNGRTHLLCVP